MPTRCDASSKAFRVRHPEPGRPPPPTKIPETNPHVEHHRRAGTIHIVEVVPDANRLLSAIEFELDRCHAPALVIDLTGDVAFSPGDDARLQQVLADPRLDGRWEINVNVAPTAPSD